MHEDVPPCSTLVLMLLSLPTELLEEVLARLEFRALAAAATSCTRILGHIEHICEHHHQLPRSEMGTPAKAIRRLASVMMRPHSIAAGEHLTLCVRNQLLFSWGSATTGDGADEDDNIWEGTHAFHDRVHELAAQFGEHDVVHRELSSASERIWEALDEDVGENARSGLTNHLCRAGDAGQSVPPQLRQRMPGGGVAITHEGRSSVPALVMQQEQNAMPRIRPVAEVSTGSHHVADHVRCLLRTVDGHVFDWGTVGESLSIGLQAPLIFYSPGPHQQLVAEDRRIVQVTTNNATNLALAASGNVWSWYAGSDSYYGTISAAEERFLLGREPGQTEGNMSALPGIVPALANAGIGRIDLGSEDHSSAFAVVRATGQLYSWGSFRACEVGSKEELSRPAPVHFLAGMPVAQVCGAPRGGFFIVLRDGRLLFMERPNPLPFSMDRPWQPSGVVFGGGEFSEFRVTGENPDSPTIRAVTVPLPEGEVAWHVAASVKHSVIITRQGHAFTVGVGLRCKGGRLGHGDGRRGVPTPTLVRALADADEFVEEASAGPDHTVFRTASGKVYTCGLGERGVLGHGDYGNRRVPTQVQLPCVEAPRPSAVFPDAMYDHRRYW